MQLPSPACLRRWQSTEHSPRGGLSPFLPWVVFSVGRLVFLTQSPLQLSSPWKAHVPLPGLFMTRVLGASKGGGRLKAAPCK